MQTQVENLNSNPMTKVKSLYFTKYKSGILELTFTFDSKKFSGCNLLSSNNLLYQDLVEEKYHVFQFPDSILEGHDIRNYIAYENTNKDQFSVVLIPQEMMIEPDVIEQEKEFLPD